MAPTTLISVGISTVLDFWLSTELKPNKIKEAKIGVEILILIELSIP
jgi:hypothetical protein